MRLRPLASALALATALPLLGSRDAAAADILMVSAYATTMPAVHAKLAATGHTVTDFNAETGTPTADELLQYDAVFAYSNLFFQDKVLMGDRFADYVDAGGGVVETTFLPSQATSDYAVSGRWVTDGYTPFTKGLNTCGATLTMVPVAGGDPLLAGVASLGTSGCRNIVEAANGATLVADWSNGDAAIAHRSAGTGQIVGLNFWLVDTISGDVTRLLTNVLDMASDSDGDGFLNTDDTCPSVANAGQEDLDEDGIGDVCDDDADGDGTADDVDNCLDLANAAQGDIDGDGIGDACEDDRDDDGVDDDADDCVGVADPNQEDEDENGIGDACQSGAEPLDILYLHTNPTAAADVEAKLEATGRFASVDLVDVSNDAGAAPALATLQAYDAVLVSSGFNDIVPTLGDLLADYADDGGGVVVCALGFYDDAFGAVTGRFESDGYAPYTYGSVLTAANLQLTPELPDHPLLVGVDAFDAGAVSYHHPVQATRGTVNVAQLSDGRPLIATRTANGSRVVGLNFFPASSDFSNGFWLATTDGADILANALEWAGGCDGVDFDDDGVPDACDSFVDRDGDTIQDADDNCIDVSNTDQIDVDEDDIGDACDELIDSDGDLIADDDDNCPQDANPDQANSDDDDDGNACDDDDDDDGVDDVDDNCPLVPNANQADGDDDDIGDVCEDDQDGDGIPDDEDNCPITANASQADADGDDIGDACDTAGEGGGGQGGGGQGGAGEGGSGEEGGAGPGPGPGPDTSAGPSGSGGSDAVTSATSADSASATGSGGDAAGDGEDGGCGCEVPGGATAPRGGWLAAAALGLAVTVRRRRRSA